MISHKPTKRCRECGGKAFKLDENGICLGCVIVATRKLEKSQLEEREQEKKSLQVLATPMQLPATPRKPPKASKMPASPSIPTQPPTLEHPSIL